MSRELMNERLGILFEKVCDAIEYAKEARDYSSVVELTTLGMSVTMTDFVNSSNRQNHEDRAFPPLDDEEDLDLEDFPL